MSRMIPPTPVAAPSYGSTADGWLWLSMRIATASPSPMSTTPAPSPGPTSTQGASVGKRPRYARDDLYEQCSDHMTEYMASSRCVGSRPSSSTTAASSSSVTPTCRCSTSAIGFDRTESRICQNGSAPFSDKSRYEMPSAKKKTAMTDAHKAALAEGRNQARIVGNYLEAIDAHKPKRGRRRTS